MRALYRLAPLGAIKSDPSDPSDPSDLYLPETPNELIQLLDSIRPNILDSRKGASVPATSNKPCSRGGIMIRKALMVVALAVVASISTASVSHAQQAQQAYGKSWGGAASNRDYARFYHYPYVYYPQNFYGSEYYRSSDSMYHRYAPEAQIPVYNRHWYNEYPTNRRYHWGHHFILDVF